MPVTSFRVRRIPWFEGDVSILLQEDNGPCPLIGLANVIALVSVNAGGGLKLPPDATFASVEHVLSVVAEYALAKVATTTAATPDMEARVLEFINTLPTLLQGVSLNPRLSSPNYSRVLLDSSARSDAVVSSFEFDGSTSMYDVIDVQLVHAWIVAPSDSPSAIRALEGSLFSKAQELLVALDAATAVEVVEVTDSAEVVEVTDSPTTNDKGENEGDGSAAVIKGEGEGKGDSDVAVVTNNDGGEGGSIAVVMPMLMPREEETGGAAAMPALADCGIVITPPPLPIISPAAVEDAKAVKEWLKRYQTQATPYGVSVLTSLLRNNELACLYRNNHLSVVFKFKDRLYTLVTAAAFAEEPSIIWETLEATEDCAVRNNTRFCDGAFKVAGEDEVESLTEDDTLARDTALASANSLHTASTRPESSAADTAFERDLALAAALSLGQAVPVPRPPPRHRDVDVVPPQPSRHQELPRAAEALPPAPLGPAKVRVVVSENERRSAGARLATELAAERRARSAMGPSSTTGSRSGATHSKKKESDCSIV